MTLKPSVCQGCPSFEVEVDRVPRYDTSFYGCNYCDRVAMMSFRQFFQQKVPNDCIRYLEQVIFNQSLTDESGNEWTGSTVKGCDDEATACNM